MGGRRIQRKGNQRLGVSKAAAMARRKLKQNSGNSAVLKNGSVQLRTGSYNRRQNQQQQQQQQYPQYQQQQQQQQYPQYQQGNYTDNIPYIPGHPYPAAPVRKEPGNPVQNTLLHHRSMFPQVGLDGCMKGRCGAPSWNSYPLPVGQVGPHGLGFYTCITSQNDHCGCNGCIGTGGCFPGDANMAGFAYAPVGAYGYY